MTGGLNMGLGLLMEENSSDESPKKSLRMSEIEPDPNQPRKSFSEEAITALADSIREYGMLQPILVRPRDDGMYTIVAGERRWRAARMLGLDEVPVVIREMNDREAMEIALIENLQREDLSAIEEAEGYETLIEEYGMTQELVAKTVGKSRSYIANLIRILDLPDTIKEYVEHKEISIGAARALLGIENKEVQLDLAKRAADGRISVRQIENVVKSLKEIPKDETGEKKIPPKQDSYYKETELSLSEHLGRKVKVDFSERKKKGTLVLEFYNKEDLSDIANKLANLDI